MRTPCNLSANFYTYIITQQGPIVQRQSSWDKKCIVFELTQKTCKKTQYIVKLNSKKSLLLQILCLQQMIELKDKEVAIWQNCRQQITQTKA